MIFFLCLPLPGELQNSLLTPLLADTAALASFFACHIFTVQGIVPVFSTQQTLLLEFFINKSTLLSSSAPVLVLGTFCRKLTSFLFSYSS